MLHLNCRRRRTAHFVYTFREPYLLFLPAKVPCRRLFLSLVIVTLTITCDATNRELLKMARHTSVKYGCFVRAWVTSDHFIQIVTPQLVKTIKLRRTYGKATQSLFG